MSKQRILKCDFTALADELTKISNQTLSVSLSRWGLLTQDFMMKDLKMFRKRKPPSGNNETTCTRILNSLKAWFKESQPI